jgi:enoyl-CoA hydratase
MITAVRSVPQAVIAAVNGPAAGAGFAIALASDIRVASSSARFHVGAVRIGLSGGECGMSYLLPRHVGVARAAEILLTGRPVDAAEAERIGLVARVVADEDLAPAAHRIADAVAANSPYSTWMTKRAIWSNLDADFAGAVELENRTQVLASLTGDSREAIEAFAEKRDPLFTGR